MDYQVAQKLHACTDPHQPPDFQNDRVRDIVDLTLIHDTFYPDGAPLRSLRAAVEEIFGVRAVEAFELGRTPRRWPPVVETNPLWRNTYAAPASQAGLEMSLDDAIGAINDWIHEINDA